KRLGEAGEEDHPHPPVGEDVALDHMQEERGHCANFLENERLPQRQPAITHAASTAMCATAGQRSIDPVRAPRQSSPPSHNGASTHRGWSTSGSWEIGKNVPENRNRGRMPIRMISGKRASVSWVAANAVRGAANAAAHKAAAGTANTPHGDSTAPRMAATPRKLDAPTKPRPPAPATPRPQPSTAPPRAPTVPLHAP